jgi:hypothetical protein
MLSEEVCTVTLRFIKAGNSPSASKKGTESTEAVSVKLSLELSKTRLLLGKKLCKRKLVERLSNGSQYF